MRVEGLNHVNISTRDVEATARFYADILGFVPRGNVAKVPLDEGRWLYDANDEPIVHLRRFDSDGDTTGPIHHVALTCSGMAELIQRLEQRGIEHRVNDGGYGGFKQVFLRDPEGVLLELNFTGE